MTVGQTFANHRHLPRLFIAGCLLLLLGLLCFVAGWLGAGATFGRVGMLLLIATVAVLLTISRRYITALQDRIITLEMAVRGRDCLSPAQRSALARLGKAQVIALRFAPDDELGPLIDRAAAEQLSANDIKKAIRNWRPDYNRT